jgi:hypothetical protein
MNAYIKYMQMKGLISASVLFDKLDVGVKEYYI